MVKILYEFDIEGAIQEDPFLSEYELGLMFEQTKRSLGVGLERQLGHLRCDDHNDEPTITITGNYDAEREELDVQYHVDTCCKLFMVRVIKTMNNVN